MKCSCFVPVSSWDEFRWLCMAMAIYNYIRSRLCAEIITPFRADRR